MNTKESSKDRLIRTASRLFQLQGYHATGLNQITQESGAPKGSLYYYFPNGKEELAIEAVRLTAAFVTERIEDGLQHSTDSVEAIQYFIKHMAEGFQKENHIEGVPIAAVALETSLISDSLRKECQSAYTQFQNAFTKKLRQAGYEEEKAKELGGVINSMIEGAFLLSFTMGNSDPLFSVAKQIPVILQ